MMRFLLLLLLLLVFCCTTSVVSITEFQEPIRIDSSPIVPSKTDLLVLGTQFSVVYNRITADPDVEHDNALEIVTNNNTAIAFRVSSGGVVSVYDNILHQTAAYLHGSGGVDITGPLFARGDLGLWPGDGIVAHPGGGQTYATLLDRPINIVDLVASSGDSVRLGGPAHGIIRTVRNNGNHDLALFPEPGGVIEFSTSPLTIPPQHTVQLCFVSTGWRIISV